MSNVTTAYFLLALIGCITAQFTHPALWEVAQKSRVKRLGCSVDASVDLSSTIIHWYRQKHGQALQRILYFAGGSSSGTKEAEFSSRFTGGKKDRTFTLTISSTTEDYAATYYCARWSGDIKVFSSGIRLYVTDSINKKKIPNVSAFPVSRPHSNGACVLLCQARGMFPDQVKFNWHAEDQSGQNVDLKEEEMLEQRDEDQEIKITSMLIVDKQKVKTSKFTCSVQHDNEQRVDIPRFQEEDEETPVPVPVPVNTCPTPKETEQKQEEKAEEEEEKPAYGAFELRCSLYLFSVTYVILVVKNVLYFCTVSILLYKRNAENKEVLSSKAR